MCIRDRFINGDDKALLVLDKKLLKELRYNSRVYEANKFNVATLKEAELLSSCLLYTS